jgi:hypothetical protein
VRGKDDVRIVRTILREVMPMRWTTVDEAARILGRSGESIRKLVRRHPREVGRRDLANGRYLIDLGDLRRLVEEVGRG